MMNSTEVVVHSKTNFVKMIQNQLLFWKPLMLCANWYCKIIMLALVRHTAYIQYCMNICLSTKFVRVGSHTISYSLKTRLVPLGWKKCFKNTIAVLRNTFMTKVAHAQSTSKQRISCFFFFSEKLDMSTKTTYH